MSDTLPAVRATETHDLARFVDVPPEVKLEAGRRAAVQLKKMIGETKSSVRVGQTEHIKAEAWQTVGSFFHVTVRTRVEPCDIDGTKGAHAIAELLDDSTGNVVGGGEGYCMRDEPNWRNKAWFQVASMAQTRAMSRGLSNKFKWITVMAGYSPTPYEEMEAEHHPPPRYSPPPQRTAPPVQTAQAVPADSEAMTFDAAKIITEVTEMLAAMNAGEADLMDQQLEGLTRWKDKATGTEKCLRLSDLPNIANRKPDWLKGIHKKVAAEYQKAIDAKGQTKQ